jgi:hypothetical protein
MKDVEEAYERMEKWRVGMDCIKAWCEIHWI